MRPGNSRERDLHTEAGGGLPQLTSDRAAAQDDHRGGVVRRGQRLVTGPDRHLLQAVHGRYRRPRAGGHDQLTADQLTAIDVDAARKASRSASIG